jgi:hypothetical protein
VTSSLQASSDRVPGLRIRGGHRLPGADTVTQRASARRFTSPSRTRRDDASRPVRRQSQCGPSLWRGLRREGRLLHWVGTVGSRLVQSARVRPAQLCSRELAHRGNQLGELNRFRNASVEPLDEHACPIGLARKSSQRNRGDGAFRRRRRSDPRSESLRSDGQQSAPIGQPHPPSSKLFTTALGDEVDPVLLAVLGRATYRDCQ